MADVVDFKNYRDRHLLHPDDDDLLDDDDSPFDEDDFDFIDEDIDEDVTPEEEAAARRRRILQGVSFCVGAALVVLLIILQSRSRTYTSASFSKVSDLLGQDGTSYYALDGNIVSCSRDGVSCVDTRGNQVWTITYEMQRPIVSIAGGVMAIGDYDGSSIYIVNSRQFIGSVDTNMPIRALTVAENGEVAAVLNDTNVTWVYIFDSGGNTIAYFKTTMGQSGYPIGVAVSPDGQIVAVSHLTIGNSTANTSIAFYNFGAVGQNSVENNVAGFNYEDEIFPFIVYMNSSTCVAVSDQRIAYFTGSEIPQEGASTTFSTNIQGVYSNERYVAILFPDTSGEAEWIINVYNTAGDLVNTIPFTMDYTAIQLSGDRIVINNDQSIMIYNIDGTLKFSGTFDMTFRAVIPQTGSTNRLTVITDTEMDSMVLE